MPVKICQLELSEPLRELELEPDYNAVWLLVRLQRRPIGYVKLVIKDGRIGIEELKQGLAEQLSWNLSAHLTEQLLSQGGLRSNDVEQFRATMQQFEPVRLPEPAPKISVAICTRDRPESLRRCLQAMEKLDYPNFEVLVVDNAPRTSQTAQLVQQWPGNSPLSGRLRYIIEARPGVSWGRNRAIQEAQGEIVAYADDDVVVDRDWLTAIAQDFSDPTVGCVTGLIVPLELETKAQELFEKYGGFGRGFFRRYYHYTNQPHSLYPLGTGIFGTGANVAYRRAMFDQIGRFETFFGPGTATAGAEDHDMFFRVLRHDYGLVYEPAALLFHQHRRDMEGLALQLQNFGRAEMAYFTNLFLKYPDERRRTLGLVRWWFVIHGLRRMWHETRYPSGFPRRLILAEMRGSLDGLRAYFRARRQARQIAAGDYQTPALAVLWKEGEKVSEGQTQP